jgi:hypothetical protein
VLVWLEEGLRSTEQELDGEAERRTRELLRYQEKTHMSKEFVDISNGARKGVSCARKSTKSAIYLSRPWQCRETGGAEMGS